MKMHHDRINWQFEAALDALANSPEIPQAVKDAIFGAPGDLGALKMEWGRFIEGMGGDGAELEGDLPVKKVSQSEPGEN